MISVEQALKQVLDLFTPLESEEIHLTEALGRVLAEDVIATHNQPPFASSAMDGFALRRSDVSSGTTLDIIGESAAGDRFPDPVASGQAVRIFTGAPVPEGADMVLIQENTTHSGSKVTITDADQANDYIRPAGGDFKIGDRLSAPCRLGPTEIGLIAAMNCGRVTVRRKPEIALIATGDELMPPGGELGPDQIASSNNYALKALVEQYGGIARVLPIARDDADSLRMVLSLTQGADAIVTLGGASVGDHDLVRGVAEETGLETAFYKVAIRPGKPLMAGKYNGIPMIGLPGNPVSSLVCGHVFLRPALNAMLGLGRAALPREQAKLAVDQPANGPRCHYMRAQLDTAQGTPVISPFNRQDSSLLSVMARADVLLVRPENDPARSKGETVEFIRL
jgi:molybdopterin molybdotransferase